MIADKFYIRHREGHPETNMQCDAFMGFKDLGVEIGVFEWIDDIDEIKDLGPTVGVAGYIGDICRALKVVGMPVPENIDYPDQLKEYLGRGIWKSTLGDVRTRVGPLFIKPSREHKLFTGFVWTQLSDARRRVVTIPDEVPVWVSDVVDFRAEYRCFILEDEILDCRLYKGDWSIAPSRDVVESAVRAMKGKRAAYCLDWGVTSTGKTLLVEMNEGYAFGNYGLHPTYYARMLEARWASFFNTPTE